MRRGVEGLGSSMAAAQRALWARPERSEGSIEGSKDARVVHQAGRREGRVGSIGLRGKCFQS